jgi:hypothetical protein
LGLFAEWFNMSSDPIGDFNMDLMAERANFRFQQTKATNPNFYYGPYTGLVARNAGYVFARRLFANHSKAHLSGILSMNSLTMTDHLTDALLAKNIIKTFFAISGEEGKFTYNRGWESIPRNWYRTPVDYGLAQLNSDIVSFTLEYPDLGRCVVPRMFIE